MLDGDGRPLRPGERLALPPLWLAAGTDGEALLAAWAAACGARDAGARRPSARRSAGAPGTTTSPACARPTCSTNLEALRRLRGRVALRLRQVDDGYQRAIGDWLEPNAKFPHGMRWLAQRIRAAGFDAGIWLAPFLARPEARLCRAAPRLVRAHRGRAASRRGCWNPMWSLGRPAYALDTTHPEVLDWLRELARTVVHQWGYRILKLDFLYAAALPGVRYDRGATRAEALRRGLEAIRDGAGADAFLLGCGCPLGPAIGIVDGMRIGADVAPFWNNWISRGPLRDRHGVATKHADAQHADPRLHAPPPVAQRSRLPDGARRPRPQLTPDEVRTLAAVDRASPTACSCSATAWRPCRPSAWRGSSACCRCSAATARVDDLFERDLPELLRCRRIRARRWSALFNFSGRPRRPRA